ncbi:NusG domain II-containing protein [Clostridium sp. HBUAS56010]|uniref:NusG domain II-containing protein n=1 Tax=Clostridium sp. HBUAS56010 TaxID=2571127 RepID=UPI001177662C|nr:NusG domain II-containing protein [Clostridium sp. HBUAS56010]
MNIKHYKKELMLAVGILIIAGILFFANQIIFSKPAKNAVISVDGEVVKTLNLNKDADMTITGYSGGTNRIIVKNGEIQVSEASCPDKVCVHQGWVKHTGENIVCLPNHMIVQIVGD